jgi:putative cardiolipin synthase
MDLSKIERTPSAALATPGETRLGAAVAEEAAKHPGLSGFRLLGDGLDAFSARLALIARSERTLDLQYYIVHGDTAAVIAAGLVKAADRGVRVRVLVDDTTTTGRDDAFAAIDAHPNVEVRLWNPMLTGRTSYFGRLGNYLTRGIELNRRMHNKLFIADNAAAIVGGRNLGDEYFEAQAAVLFRDLDVVSVGPVVREVSATFDAYWNSEWAVPMAAVHPGEPSAERLAAMRSGGEAAIARIRDGGYAKAVRESPFVVGMLEGKFPLSWARGTVVADSPEKIRRSAERSTGNMLLPRLAPAFDSAREEVLLISPYFVPRDRGTKLLVGKRESGVRVRVLTNSLAANDVPVVHSGYLEDRGPLVRGGVEVYELKANAAATEAEEQRRSQIGSGSSPASLHAKSLVFDRRTLFVGSMNLDPRSIDVNTEVGLLIASAELAGEVGRAFDVAALPRTSYRVVLDPSGRGLVWQGEENGTPKTWTTEPETTFWKRATAWFLSWLPIEGQI